MQRSVLNLKPVSRVPAKWEVKEDDYAFSGSRPSPCKNNTQENREWHDKYDGIPLAVFRDNGIQLSRSMDHAPAASSVIIGRKRPLPTERRSSLVTPTKCVLHEQKGQSSGLTATSRILPYAFAKRWSSHAHSSSAINTSFEYARKRERTATLEKKRST